MKWHLSLLAVLATLAVAHPQNQAGGQGGAKGVKGQGNQGQTQGQANNAGKGAAGAAAAADNVNAKANNGKDGVTAAAKVDAAVLLSEAGDPGAQDSGPEFEAAVKAIVGKGKQADVDTLKAAGIDVDAVVGGGKNAGNKPAANGQAQQGKAASANN